MKRLAVLSFIVGLLALPIQALRSAAPSGIARAIQRYGLGSADPGTGPLTAVAAVTVTGGTCSGFELAAASRFLRMR